MTIRERIAELTAGIKTQCQMDGAVARGIMKQIHDEFPNIEMDEFAYEWDLRKNQLRGMTAIDD